MEVVVEVEVLVLRVGGCLTHRSDFDREYPDVVRAKLDEVMPHLPAHLGESIDAIRAVGNFAAHPKSLSSGEIVEVEPGEAEWNLDVLDGLFDFYYVQPTRTRQRRAHLEKKLKEVGKPPPRRRMIVVRGSITIL